MVTTSQDFRMAVNRASFAERLGIIPDDWQRDLLRSDSDRVILNCCRQRGKSSMSAMIALHKAVYFPGSLTLILAPAERQAKETFSKVLTLYRKLGHAIPPDSYRKLGMQLGNGSRIEALPGSQRTIRGFSAVDLLVLDEAARIEDELYHAVRPMLSVSAGSLLMASSPDGRRGVFFEEWTEGIGWERYMITAAQVPRISEAFLEEERRDTTSEHLQARVRGRVCRDRRCCLRARGYRESVRYRLAAAVRGGFTG